ncbi:MAG: EamA family transporter [Deltaproteobacteria bacterium]|jgi:multidrug transporter EmrE-like cation transporter|nr:EamA family transporter [Deltaproteobacteria bacterium]
MKTLTVILFSGNIAFNALANLLMKVGMRHAPDPSSAGVPVLLRALLSDWRLIAGVLAYAASLGFYMFAIRDVKLSVAYPLSVSCAIVLVTALSALLLRESVSARQLAGGAVILAGILLLAS